MKKEWTKPKLISLYRGRPQEAVLTVCKTTSGTQSGPGEPLFEGCAPTGPASCEGTDPS